MTPGSKTLTAPPAPTGSPALLRAYAGSLHELATTLRRQAASIVSPLPPTWRGDAPTAAAATAIRLATEFREAAGAVDDMAAHLEKYAATLATAASHHHHWLTRVAEVAGVVLVTAAVVTITVATAGAAAPVAAGLAIAAEGGATAATSAAAEAAAAAATAAAESSASAAASAAGAAVAGMEDAAAVAAAAENTLVGSLGTRVLPLLRQLGAFVRPQLVGAEVSSGFDAAVHVGHHGSLSPYTVGLDLIENIAIGGGVGAAASKWLVKPGLAATLGRLLSPRAAGAEGRRALVRHLANATTNATVDAAEDKVVGKRDSGEDIGLDFLEGLIGSGVGDAAAAHDVNVARSVNTLRNLRLPQLSLDADGKVLRAHVGGVYRVDPNNIRFSQSSLSNTGIRVTAMSPGWDGEPISVFVMPDGSLTTLDNRRVMAARAHGIQANIRLVDPTAVVPADQLAERFGRYKLPPGSTWGDVIRARIGKQGWKGAHPNGSIVLPTKVRPGAVEIVGIRPPREVRRAV